jgi:eukaryotic-like serine/threonine-protein kinase
MHRGERIAGRFELEREAAKGGMGTVYRAVDLQTRIPVAVKVLRGREVGGTARFQRETALLAELSHPGIVKYVSHGVDAASGLHYLVMEWVDGETLLDRLERVGLSPAETVQMTRQVARALHEAHRHGVVHRDIKPSNLMFAGGDIDRVKLLDFGIARRATEMTDLTQTGVMVGTLGYMSPEQARATRSVTLDARTDIFALGCVLYECLTGRAPFSGENMMAVRAKILLSEPAEIASVTNDVPAPLIELVGRMMSKEPSGRPPDALALAAQLDEVEDGTLAGTRRPSAVPADEQPTRTIVDDAPADDIVCVVLVTPMLEDEDDEGPVPVDPAWIESQGRIIQQAIAPYDGKLHSLADGSMVVTVAGDQTPTELATRAARCALAIRAEVPEANIVVAAESSPAAAHSVGRVIDRGVRVMGQATISATFAELAGDDASTADIWLDDTSARLLADQFEIREARAGHRLLGER